MPVERQQNQRQVQKKLYLGDWLDTLGLTQADLVRITGMTRAYISELCAGHKNNPSIAMLLDISDSMGISVNDLYRPPPERGVLKGLNGLNAGQVAALGQLLDTIRRPRQK
jgi:transcriptional regulator with XRE-family HTH domain